ncbi:isochorismatase [Mycobacterium sp. djl-10]|nr:isochorismatase [Mycobacterium sp. djl-10]
MTATAVLVIDMLNAYEHPDADKLVPNVEPTVEPLADLIARTRKRDDADLIYVNDNYGDFTADHSGLVASALDGARPDLVKPLVPDENCRFLMKVRHSAFYATSLGYLLNQLDAQRVILTGQVTEQCILYSALDAYVRHFEVVVARDCVAAIDNELGRAALTMMESNMRASILDAADCLE